MARHSFTETTVICEILPTQAVIISVLLSQEDTITTTRPTYVIFMMNKPGKVFALLFIFAQSSLLYAKELVYLPGTPASAQTASESYRTITENSAADHKQVLSQYSSSAISGSLNQAVFEQNAKQLMMGLPKKNPITVLKKTFSKVTDEHSKWIGTVAGDADSSVAITTYKGVSVGRIETAGRVYQLKPSRNDDYIIEELNMQAFPNCDNDLQHIIQSPGKNQDQLKFERSASAADPVVIDLLAVYTPAARIKNGGHTGIQALIQAAVDIANLAFTDSNMDIVFQLVHTTQVNYVEGTSSQDLVWIRDDPGVKNLRNDKAADMVSLITAGNYCGIGYVQRNPGASFEDFAYQVTADDCAVGNLTFAHEHGHNMGMEHDPANGASPANASFVYSYGHFVNGSYRTVMSYPHECIGGCTRVAHFSNPNVMHNSAATGIANQRDNARTGRFTAPIVADFRTPQSADDDDFLLFLPAILSGSKQ